MQILAAGCGADGAEKMVGGFIVGAFTGAFIAIVVTRCVRPMHDD